MSLQSLLLPLIIVLFAVPLFLGTRKQKRAVAKQQELQNSLAPGDRVMTTSGLYATVVDSNEDTIDLEIAEGITTTWLRAAVREKVADTDTVEEYEDDAELDTDSADEVEVPEHESGAELAPPLEESKKGR
ncbi:MAG TPA: preprotein translocase subunit YajC [Pseudonocardiaceae bacterium]|jgi:preprotein translocase subunit YajC|nr:preprotein translocase subunit YajC [Pseudonocardiaceae bacterium]